MAADVTLHDGREITIDEFAITHGEFTAMVAGTSTDAQDEAIFKKACGLSDTEIAALPEKDWRLLTRAVLKKITTPDPN
jgi:hypothetical protein